MVEYRIEGSKRRYSLPTSLWLHSRATDLMDFTSSYTINHVGRDRYTADGAALLLQFSDMLHGNHKTPHIYDFYSQVFDLGMEDGMRTFGIKKRNEMYNAKGYLSSIAENIGIDEQILRRLIRAFRATMVYESHENPLIDQSMLFRKSIMTLFEQDQSLPPSQRDERLLDLISRWNGSVTHFYALIYNQKANGQWIGRFLPYEVDFFSEQVNEFKRKKNIMSLFTKTLIREMIQNRNVNKTAEALTQETKVPINNNVIDDYIYLLSSDFPTKLG